MTARRIGFGSIGLGLVVVAWAIVIARSDGMVGGFGSYLGLWTAMTVAMMLPSAAPMLLLVDRLSHEAMPPFALGYLLAWTAFGAAAYAVSSRIHWHATAAVLIAAGVYQVLPFKRACLRRCRNPLGFLRDHAREPPLVVGVRHGGYCVGCCAGLMSGLLALGMMNIVWMALAAAAVLAEKTLPGGDRLAPLSAIGLVGAGAWLVLA